MQQPVTDDLTFTPKAAAIGAVAYLLMVGLFIIVFAGLW